MSRHYREDGHIVWETDEVSCTVKPFCSQNTAAFQWQCVVGKIGPKPELRATGSAETGAGAVEEASKYAKVLNYIYFST
jgi:hypothetical protein